MTRAMVGFCFSVLLLFVVVDVEGFVRRDVSPEPSSMHLLDSFQENMDQFRRCIDQSLARAAGEVNEKQLQPLFTAISDHLGRVSKAFDDLTAPSSTQGSAKTI